MKGDFSRIRFSPKKQYTAVLEQQGRVALDADTNEQCNINNYLRERETLDIVGQSGGPVGDEGFAITVNDNGIEIGAGRYYVNGIFCENLGPLAYLQQPYLINPSPTDADLIASLGQGSISVIQVYLEVWQRLVTELDDPCLREPALGQADTTDRLQTVWRVVASAPPSASGFKPTSPPRVPVATISAARGPIYSRFPQFKSAVADSVRSFTFSGATAAAASGFTPSQIFDDCCAQMLQPIKFAAPGKMTAFTGGGGEDCSCQPTPPAGYMGLENQFYRIEIQQGGNETQATFKWSRENASVVVAVTGISGSNVYIDSLGPDANLGFSPGQWVEISDDSNLFGLDPNQPGDLYQMQSITPETFSVTMTQTVAFADPTKNARMRRWDQFGSSAGSTGISLPVVSPYVLENGISVQFTAGQFEPGDYWLIPARTATGEIEWPPCDSDGSSFQPPHRVRVDRAPLACIQWDSTLGQAVPHDCRDKFYPLIELTPPTPPQTLQVTQISWSNDDVMTLDQLVASGLTVTLNQNAPDPRYLTPANFSVVLEVALPFGPASQFPATSTRLDSAFKFQEFVASTIGISRAAPLASFEGGFVTLLRYELVIDGRTSSTGTNLLWQMPWEPKTPAETLTLELLEVLLVVGALRNDYGRVRVKLAGNRLFAGPLNQIFLDGFCLGTPAIRADGTTPRLDLNLPSGSGVVASDFDSWFYLAPTQLAAGLGIDHPNLLVNPDGTVVDAGNPGGGPVSPQGTVTLLYPAVIDTVVNLSLTGPSSAGIFSIPGSVTVSRGNKTGSFPIIVQGNPGPVTDSWQVIASLTNALNLPSSQSATLTITGSQGITGVFFNVSGLGISMDASRKVTAVDVANRTGGEVIPQGTITLSSPSSTPTVVSLSVAGAEAGVITVPQTVTVPANQTQVTFPITVVGVPKAAQSLSINASISPAVGVTSSKTAALAVHSLT